MFRFTAQILSAIALLLAPIAVSQTTSVDYCEALLDVISICQLETPSFTQLAATAQADCLCGTSLGTLSWGPATFDGLASDCAIQYATVNTLVAGDAGALQGFCTSFAAGAQSVSAIPTSSAVFNTATSSVVLNTGLASPQTSATSVAANTDTGLYTTPTSTTESIPAATTVFSVVTIAQTISSTTSSRNAAVNDQQQQGLRSIVGTLVVEVVVLVAYMM